MVDPATPVFGLSASQIGRVGMIQDLAATGVEFLKPSAPGPGGHWHGVALYRRSHGDSWDSQQNGKL